MQGNVKVFKQKPFDFDPKVFVAAAYVEVNGKILLLQLSNRKENPMRWGVPAGKLELGETPENALRRELFEETGIFLDNNSPIYALGQLFIRKPQLDYIYQGFKVSLSHIPPISLSQEHLDYKWVTLEEAKKLELVDGAEDALNFYVTNSKGLLQMDQQ